jgi:hypothetical protein
MSVVEWLTPFLSIQSGVVGAGCPATHVRVVPGGAWSSPPYDIAQFPTSISATTALIRQGILVSVSRGLARAEPRLHRLQGFIDAPKNGLSSASCMSAPTYFCG